MSDTQELLQNTNLTEYFRELVRYAIAKHKVDLTEHSEFYLVNLLAELKKNDTLPQDTPLALLLGQAAHADVATRVRTLKALGDTALFVAGIFPRRATRHFKTLDYYIRMGGGAYLSLADSLFIQRGFGELYEEMGLKFRHLVNILTEVGLSGRQQSDLDLLGYYEQFLATGDQRLREILQNEGILPVKPGGSQ